MVRAWCVCEVCGVCECRRAWCVCEVCGVGGHKDFYCLRETSEDVQYP